MADGNNSEKGKTPADEGSADVEGGQETVKGKGKAVLTDRLQASGRAAFNAMTGTSSITAMPHIIPRHKTATAGPSSQTSPEEASWQRAVRAGPAESFRTGQQQSSEAFDSFVQGRAQDTNCGRGSGGEETWGEPTPASFADQEAADGIAVAALLSLPDDAADAFSVADDSLSPNEAARLSEALFGGDATGGSWDKLLDFTPDFVSLPDAAQLQLGTADEAVARRIWLQQWSDVLSSYTREVWGDLGPLAAEARHEVEQHMSEGPRESRALHRLRLVLAHLRGSHCH
ncbi:hypothetical protein XA68_13030 [Ophiocordyceps unilateralis]|uniref:Uncharacterized protein n=1 Tax=Ophiocordyceps unilateralis TaxID=268505 RepID=A0A2A9PD47_OPHUN|nr:hypothetical protein XA68_13030 [Ophiocordyceps unilateralis]